MLLPYHDVDNRVYWTVHCDGLQECISIFDFVLSVFQPLVALSVIIPSASFIQHAF